MTNDDRFRQPGSPYEEEEPVAFAVVARGALVDWGEHLPAHALWIPESLFGALAALARASPGRIDIYLQTRLTPRQVRAVLRELPASAAGVTGECLDAVREVMAQSLARGGDLIVEGP